ncbi:Gfo/Idh/MocA family oxidoreductase [Phytoactinopolyspora alkaliphila]|uniref:Gfo/Idh/MocA family oxidoreductase n=1 Tax=Phytoactinopolyspora alkaliphila TaxID=1783498 RepID=A0A6N9YT72_9ACTN|nr:Gfo/Idh/MocA family oxidoreductase [Phytoactinopolyspora alkaliphila]NED98019.1 Gfo/Idh/MocA family oxidoreductase [Phytoactinopolyspora alkaliphila]
MNSGPVGVAVVGAGVISKQYLANLTRCPDVSVVAVADLDVDRASAVAAEHEVPVAGDVATILVRDDVELVVNLTVPAAHATVARAALAAGKHVFGEKPLVLDVTEGEKLLAEAAEKGLRIGCAPDTVLGSGIQSTARAISAGVIGTPIAATTAVQSFGPEIWHPSPEFLFQSGAGPLFDLGPYYLTTLVTLFGSAHRVAATARTGRAERVIGSGPKAGTRFSVEVPTHVNALVDFDGGPTASSTFSFDSVVRRTMIEIAGTEGTLSVPDPNRFEGSLEVLRPGAEDWERLPVSGATLGRGIGVVEMARAIRAGQSHRASAEIALHVLELMAGIAESAESGRFVTLKTGADRPDPLSGDWDPLAATLV